MPKLEDVFGINIVPVLSYVERPDVDGKFISAIAGHHHIVIYGSSKQGKTALRQKHVEEGRCLTDRCDPKSTPAVIYQSVLRDAGIRIETTETRSESVKGGAKGAWSFRAILPFFGSTDATGEVSAESGRGSERVIEYIETEFADSQMVGSLLKKAGFRDFVVIENFHYLNREVQQQLAIHLKTFHELGIRFVILGVWRESNLLLSDNFDLQDRVAEIPVEPWNDAEFDRIIANGESLLNISIPAEAAAAFKENAYRNVGLFQEFLKSYCQHNGVAQTIDGPRKVLDATHTIQKAIDAKVEDHKVRLQRVLESISARSRPEKRAGREDPLTLPYYLVQVLLLAPVEELRDGMTRQHLLEQIRKIHRRKDKNTIRMNDIQNLLRRLPDLQQDIQSPFLYYTHGQLRIVDAGLLFALARVDRAPIRDEILDPLSVYDEDDDGIDELILVS